MLELTELTTVLKSAAIFYENQHKNVEIAAIIVCTSGSETIDGRRDEGCDNSMQC